MKELEFDNCPTFEIAAYIDGELDLTRELELEMHFAACPVCSEELNHQKQFLCTLNSSLRSEEDIELPKNFARQIVANAESNVVGLRGSRERFNAVFIIAALSLFVLFALGDEAGNRVAGLTSFLEQAAAVVGIFARIIYSFFVGIAVVARAMVSPFQTGLLVSVTFFAIASVFLVRFFNRLPRD